MGASCSLVMVLLPHVTSHTTPSQRKKSFNYEQNKAKRKEYSNFTFNQKSNRTVTITNIMT
jgi:hypothetical protein